MTYLYFSSFDSPLCSLQFGDESKDGDNEGEDEDEQHDDGDHLPGQEAVQGGAAAGCPGVLGLQVDDRLLGQAGAGHVGPDQPHRAGQLGGGAVAGAGGLRPAPPRVQASLLGRRVAAAAGAGVPGYKDH